MADTRAQLLPGTRILLESGSLYEITGEAMGFGGGSILYPARRLVSEAGELRSDGFDYVIKECWPLSRDFRFRREESGGICPEPYSEEAANYLQRARQMLAQESRRTRQIYRTASRILPIREGASSAVLTLPGKEPVRVDTAITVMESLSEKGMALNRWIREKKRFTPAQTFRVLQQLLLALREVHEAGYLHLDIQDGNVFLRGTLDPGAGDVLVTLLDFGSARPMEAGKTAPIEDRVIFTSPGFSPPEMLLHNDGQLRLGPEADLYSVGCLALYLLTGTRADPRQLLLPNAGPRLKPNQLRRMKCPGHLVDRIQEFLSRSLERNPEDRYASAGEMLAVVSDLAEALQPYRTDLHTVKYDAFVCYRHSETDSAAALRLQKLLEQFRPPRGFPRRPFRRVFVDEGELSSCADFGLQIREALKNSGWLIVVCSPDTPLSPWVQLEIDTFLEYHDRSRILAVLTGGDETVSFPPGLRPDASGAGEIFAADARGESRQEVLKKLRGDALLRLAAPMLGTTFDTLKQRQKLYRIQKIAAAAAAVTVLAAGFAAYALNRAAVIAEQAARIDEEYRAALYNEALFLTEQADKRLADNDPLGAMELVLQALPGDNPDRPFLRQAEYILSKSLGVYTTPNSALNTLTPAGQITTEGDSFFCDTAGDYLFTHHGYQDGRIQVWNTETMELHSQLFVHSDDTPKPVFAHEGTLITALGSELVSVNYLTGTENWRRSLDHIAAVQSTADRSAVAVLHYDLFAAPQTGEDGEAVTALTLEVISAQTGRTLRRMALALPERFYIPSHLCLSDDGSRLAFAAEDSQKGDVFTPCCSVWLVEPDREKTLVLDFDMEVGALAFSGDNLAVLRGTGFTLSSIAGKVPYTIISPCESFFELYSPAGSLLWSQQDRLYFRPNGFRDIRPVPEQEALLCLFSNRCLLIREDTGEVLQDYALSEPMLDLQLTPRGFVTFNSDGSRSSVNFGNDRVFNYQVLEEQILSLCPAGDAFFIRSGTWLREENAIRKYISEKHDDRYVSLWENTTGEALQLAGWRTTEEGVRVLLAAENLVCMADLATGESRRWPMDPELGFSVYHLMGLSEDGGTLWWYETDYDDDSLWIRNYRFYAMDLLTGKITQVPTPRMPEELTYVSTTVFADGEVLLAGQFCRYPEDPADYAQALRWTAFYRLDLEDGSLRQLYATQPQTGDSREIVLLTGTSDRLTCIWGDGTYKDNFTGILRMEGETVLEIPVSFPMEKNDDYYSILSSCFVWNDAGTQAAFCYHRNVYVMGSDGSLLHCIPLEGDPQALQFTPDGTSLLLLTYEGIVEQHRLSDGVCTGRIRLKEHTLLSVHFSDARCAWLNEEFLLVFGSSAAFLLDISGEEITMAAVIDQCFDYDPFSHRFITIDSVYEATDIGSFPRYTTEDLTAMARRVLNRN